MPAMWFEQKFVMDPEMAEQIRMAVKVPWIGRLIGIGMLTLGLLTVIITYFVECSMQRKQSRRQKTEFNLVNRVEAVPVKKEVSPLLTRAVKHQIVPRSN